MIAARFLPAAEVELLHEVEYYGRVRAGAGVRFKELVQASVLKAARLPLGGAPTFGGTRAMLVKGFPFSVVYRVSDDEILIVAIAPHRKQPGYWRERIG